MSVLCANIQSCIATGQSSGNECPAEVVAMSLKDKPTLPCRACCIEARNGQAILSGHLVFLGHSQSTISKYNITLDWPESDVRSCAQSCSPASLFGQPRRVLDVLLESRLGSSL